MLVDSTRAGKRIPDALSKTIPIWCAVINRAVARRFSDALDSNWDNALYTPPGAVSSQEHHQIESLLDNWAEALVVCSFVLVGRTDYTYLSDSSYLRSFFRNYHAL
jgi:tRNA A64-2'-O-ribosylphosphate transferase